MCVTKAVCVTVKNMALVPLVGASVVGSLLTVYFCSRRKKVPLGQILEVADGRILDVNDQSEVTRLMQTNKKMVLYMHADW